MKTRVIFSLLALIALGACNKDDDDNTNTPPPPAPEPTLYEQLGGETLVNDPAMPGQQIEQGRLGLRSVVDSSIFVIAADPVLQPYFTTLLTELGGGNTAGLAALSESLTDFFCVATGAENFEYQGMDMVSAHDPAQNPRMSMPADDAAYDAFIADVVVGAQQNNVPAEIIGEVGTLLESLRSDIVQE